MISSSLRSWYAHSCWLDPIRIGISADTSVATGSNA